MMNNTSKKDDTLKFVLYDRQDPIQTKFLNEIASDKYISDYITDIAGDVRRSSVCLSDSILLAFLVNDASINQYVGLFVVESAKYAENTVSLKYAIHEKYRNSTDKKYGTRVLEKATSSIFMANPFNLEMIVLEINVNNEWSTKIAKKLDFVFDNSLQEAFLENGYGYVPYSKNNPFHEKIRAIREQTYTYHSNHNGRKVQ